MKIRTDFVTNSSSSCFTVEIGVYDQNGRVFRYIRNPYNVAAEVGGAASFDGKLRTLVSAQAKKPESVEALCRFLMDHVQDEYEDQEYRSRRKGKKDTVIENGSGRQEFIKMVTKEIAELKDIARVTVDRSYSAWGEFADLIPINDEKLRALSNELLSSEADAKQNVRQRLFDYIHTSEGSRAWRHFGSGFADFRYQWDGKPEDLDQLAYQIVHNEIPDIGIEHMEVNLNTGDSAKYAVFNLGGEDSIDLDRQPMHMTLSGNNAFHDMWERAKEDYQKRNADAPAPGHEALECVINVFDTEDYEEIVGLIQKGDHLTLNRRSDLTDEDCVIEVCSADGVVGYIPYSIALVLAPEMDRGYLYSAVVFSNQTDWRDIWNLRIKLIDGEGHEYGNPSLHQVLQGKITRFHRIMDARDHADAVELLRAGDLLRMEKTGRYDEFGNDVVQLYGRGGLVGTMQCDMATCIVREWDQGYQVMVVSVTPVSRSPYWRQAEASYVLMDKNGALLGNCGDLLAALAPGKGVLAVEDTFVQEYQERIEHLHIGDCLTLTPDPDDPYRYHSLAVCSKEGIVGHLPARCGDILNEMLKEHPNAATPEIVCVVPISRKSEKAIYATLDIRFRDPQGEIIGLPSLEKIIGDTGYTFEVRTKDPAQCELLEHMQEGTVLSLVREPANDEALDIVSLRKDDTIVALITDKVAPSLGAALDKDPHGYWALVTGVVPLSQRSKSAKYALLEIRIVTPAELDEIRAAQVQATATMGEPAKMDQQEEEQTSEIDWNPDDISFDFEVDDDEPVMPQKQAKKKTDKQLTGKSILSGLRAKSQEKRLETSYAMVKYLFELAGQSVESRVLPGTIQVLAGYPELITLGRHKTQVEAQKQADTQDAFAGVDTIIYSPNNAEAEVDRLLIGDASDAYTVFDKQLFLHWLRENEMLQADQKSDGTFGISLHRMGAKLQRAYSQLVCDHGMPLKTWVSLKEHIRSFQGFSDTMMMSTIQSRCCQMEEYFGYEIDEALLRIAAPDLFDANGKVIHDAGVLAAIVYEMIADAHIDFDLGSLMSCVSVIGNENHDMPLSAQFATKEEAERILQAFMSGSKLLESPIKWILYQPIFNPVNLGTVVVYEADQYENLLRETGLLEVKMLQDGQWSVCFGCIADSEEHYQLFMQIYDEGEVFCDWLFYTIENAKTARAKQLCACFADGDPQTIEEESKALITQLVVQPDPVTLTPIAEIVLNKVKCVIRLNQAKLNSIGRFATREEAAHAMAIQRWFPGIRNVLFCPDFSPENMRPLLNGYAGKKLTAFGANELEQWLRDWGMVEAVQAEDGLWVPAIMDFDDEMLAEYHQFAEENGMPLDEWLEEFRTISIPQPEKKADSRSAATEAEPEHAASTEPETEAEDKVDFEALYGAEMLISEGTLMEVTRITAADGCVTVPESVSFIAEFAFRNCSKLTKIVIPNSVIDIGDEAFKGCTGLTSIEIPNSVTGIGDWAFNGCTGLISIEIPNSVTSISKWAFEGCTGLTSIEIPNSVTSIGDGAFCDCAGLTSIEIPNSVTSIGEYAFSGCTGLTSIEIPNSVTSIGDGAFGQCKALTSLTLPARFEKAVFVAFAEDYPCVYGAYLDDTSVLCNGYTYRISKDVSLKYHKDGTATLEKYSINQDTIDLKDTINGYRIVEIKGSDVFENCSTLRVLHIPDTITSISEYAFSGLPDSVNSITLPSWCESELRKASQAWYGEYLGIDLNKVNVKCNGVLFHRDPNYKVEYHGNSVIMNEYDGDAESLTIPAFINGCRVTEIGNYFVSNRSQQTLRKLILPEGIERIHEGAFYQASLLEMIRLPDSIEDIGESAFAQNTKLVIDHLPNNLTGIEAFSFDQCESIKQMVLPPNVKYIGDDAFASCKTLEKVILPNGLVTLGDEVFLNCRQLRSIEIPASVKKIGKNIFCSYSYECDYQPLDIVVTVTAGSCAEQYCKENNIRFRRKNSAVSVHSVKTVPSFTNKYDETAFDEQKTINDTIAAAKEQERRKREARIAELRAKLETLDYTEWEEYKLNAAETKLSRLKEERAKLGFFALKAKKEMDIKINEAKDEVRKLTQAADANLAIRKKQIMDELDELYRIEG